MRTAPLHRVLPILLLAAGLARAALAAAPGDFDLQGRAGGLFPGSDNTWVHVTAAGQGTYVRYRPDSLTLVPLDSLAFTLTSGQVDQLWQTVTTNGFFALSASYSDSTFADRTFASLTIRGNAATASVTTTNIAVAGFDAIVAAVNALTPGARDLVYDTSTPIPYTPQDGCGGTMPSLAFANVRGRTKLAGQLARQASLARPEHAELDAPEAGVTVAYHISLADAVARGIATLSSKGGFYGDEVSVTVDNTAGVTTNRLTLDFNLDVFGSDATPQNAAAVSQQIQDKWGGWSSGGVPIDVHVNENVVPGASPPANMGFDQIVLGDPTSNPPVGVSATTHTATINSGTAIGAWNVQKPEYGHEAGHLMGLPDRYTDYRKQSDGSWKPEGGGSSVTASQLATLLGPTYPNLTAAQILAILNKPSTGRATVPKAGSEDDIMGNSSALPLQSDIDAIAAKAGLVVDGPAGQVFVNKDGGAQNLVTTRAIHLFVPKGQVRTIEGSWTACIDLSRHSPDFGTGIDLAPPLSQWTGAPAAAMQKLLDYIDQHGLFCDFESQFAIWDLSEDGGTPSADDSALFVAAGIAMPLPQGFPHFTDPNAGGSTTGAVTPHELFQPALTLSTPNLIAPNRVVTLAGAAPLGSLPGTTTTLHWSLAAPQGSTASLSSATGSSTTFRTDVHGTYRLHVQATVTAPADTFVVDTLLDVACADAYTETFESAAIRSGLPFHWVTAGDSAWSIQPGAAHTGSFSASTPLFSVTSSSFSLSTTMTLSAPGNLQFACGIIASDTASTLRFVLDGTVQGTFRNTHGWVIPNFAIPAGTHKLAWSFLLDPNTDYAIAALDDIAFPATAQLAGTAPDPAAGSIVSLAPTRPNPVVSVTFIPFTLPRAGHVRLAVYDLLGREVAVPADGEFGAGEQQVRFDAARLPPGVYTVRMTAGAFHATRLMIRTR